MRIATYNVEWFNALFDNHNRLIADGEWSARYNITRAMQTEALGIVFTALDADAVLVIEAPDTVRHRSTTKALEHFAELFGLRARKALLGFANTTQQEISLLFDPDKLSAVHDPQGTAGDPEIPRFDGTFRLDLDTDAAPEPIQFSKPPLEAALETAGGRRLRLIGAHLKSKAPHGATDAATAMRISIENRRKQLAQCVWLRRRIDAQLQAGDDLIVAGDFNDGPGLDEYEKLFGRSGVEVVLGPQGPTALYDPHARMALTQRVGAMPTTARFYDRTESRYFQALLDYIMVSRGIRTLHPRWRIWHPFDDPVCYRTPELREALLTASDHFPVTMDFDADG